MLARQSAASRIAPRRDDEFLNAVWEGLSAPQKALPCRYLYDARGSELFEQITRLPEYYPTRAELALLDEHGAEIASLFPRGGALIEFGSGSSRKTIPLLKAVPQLRSYIPLDISEDALYPAAERARKVLPGLAVCPVLADFTQPVTLPVSARSAPRIGFFPGSTIGNFTRQEAVRFLSAARSTLGEGSHFIIGVDLQKPLDVLLPAYDDASGVTAAFNLNLLARINRELDADFAISAFRHRAVFNAQEGRVEMHIVSQAAQSVSVAGRTFSFREGEHIHTENSHKYTLEGFAELAGRAGWTVERVWSGEGHFALFALK